MYVVVGRQMYSLWCVQHFSYDKADARRRHSQPSVDASSLMSVWYVRAFQIFACDLAKQA